MRAPLQALLALCAAALLPGSLCDIVSDSLDHDARSIVLVARPFGFEANGMVDVKVSNWHVYLEAGKPKYDPNKIGFFITTAEAEVQLQQDLAAGAWLLFGAVQAECRLWPTHTPRATPHSCWPPSWLLPPLPRLLPGAWQRRHASRGALIGFDTWALPGLVPRLAAALCLSSLRLRPFLSRWVCVGQRQRGEAVHLCGDGGCQEEEQQQLLRVPGTHPAGRGAFNWPRGGKW
jgi:hypothetical protein